MKQMYLQGQFFLKKRPEPVSLEIAQRLRNLTFLLHGKECDIKVGEDDWSHVSKLHQLIIHRNKMFLRRRGDFGKYEDELIPITKEELEEEYIDFMVFLKNSKYIGKYGVRTKPAKGNGDRSYMNNPMMVLYQSSTHIVIYSKSIITDGVPIRILDSRYCDNWQFAGEQKTIYNKPQELYSELFKASFKGNKNKGLKL